MYEWTQTTGGRRDFLRAAARYGLLTAVAAATAVLARRGRRQDGGAHRCVNRGVCCRCARAPHCILPAAVSARRHGETPRG
jgi:hypothetical protein